MCDKLVVICHEMTNGHPCIDAMSYCRAMKQLLLNSPPWVAWGITGSGTATLLANIAFTPVRGPNLRLLLATSVWHVVQLCWL